VLFHGAVSYFDIPVPSRYHQASGLQLRKHMVYVNINDTVHMQHTLN